MLALPLFLLVLYHLSRRLSQGRRALGALLPLVAIGLAGRAHDPVSRLGFTTLWLLFALKGTILLRRSREEVRAMSPLGAALYLSFWPGMDPEPLRVREAECPFPARIFVQGWVTMVVTGVAACFLALYKVEQNWVGLALILMFVHIGYSDVLTALMRWAGFPVARLFSNPFASQGLRDFWSVRWNLPFIEMNRVLFMPILLPKLGRRGALLAAFGLSGLFHEMGISFPVNAGWGGPLAYFLLQGLLMVAEPATLARLPSGLRRVFTWLIILAPAPLLFHEPFRQILVEPLWHAFCGLPFLADGAACRAQLLQWAGMGHFLVLAASFQVPARLQWQEELQRLRPLNRKLLWVYGGFIVGFISVFGGLILKLRPLMLAGETGSLYLLGLIGFFWTARLCVDALVFEHGDWPGGTEFVVGHTLLTSLFIFIALTVWMVVWAGVYGIAH